MRIEHGNNYISSEQHQQMAWVSCHPGTINLGVGPVLNSVRVRVGNILVLFDVSNIPVAIWCCWWS